MDERADLVGFGLTSTLKGARPGQHRAARSAAPGAVPGVASPDRAQPGQRRANPRPRRAARSARRDRQGPARHPGCGRRTPRCARAQAGPGRSQLGRDGATRDARTGASQTSTTWASPSASAAPPRRAGSASAGTCRGSRACSEVIDAGCGRGEFLELLRETGISAVGVDSRRSDGRPMPRARAGCHPG